MTLLRALALATTVLIIASQGFAQPAGNGPAALASLRTVAERSRYKATSHGEDVSEFLSALAAGSPLVKVSTIGTTTEGRPIPLAILADPPVATPQESAASGKLLVLCVGNIHAGEVDGKEGLLAILRDVAAAPEKHVELLKHVVIAAVPNYNADGNEKMGKDTRPGQVGPEEGQGRRENGAGLDLNRDFVKLEAPETRALIGFIRSWDPAIVIDTHTTNGSYHRYVLTYGGPKNPAGDRPIVEYVNRTMLPGVGQRLKARIGMETFFYGNFERDHAAWVDYPDEPRYGVQCIGLRNRLSILTESYSYATYEERVKAQEAFVGECLAWAAEKSGEIKALLARADEATIAAGREPGEKDRVVIRSVQRSFDAKPTVLGYVEKLEGERHVKTDIPKDYEVEHVANFVPEATVRRAWAYVLPASAQKAVDALRLHGVQVERLRERVEAEVEVNRVDKVTRAEREFQKHRTVRLEVTARKERRTLEAGSFVVKTGQRLGTLASYLLEPGAADGLATWNFFDDKLHENSDLDTVRLLVPTEAATEQMPGLVS